MHCHYTIGRLEKQLPYKPFLITKINHLNTIVHTHNTRDDDNNLICPTLKAYYCPKCKAEGRGIVYGHTPSRCSPCEYCHERGHNDRECPKKRADEKAKVTTIVLQVTKKVGYDHVIDTLRTFCEEHGIDILKTI